MLFDLRSRGRRTTVRGVYLALAILMGGGLILFGVGTGVSGGGLLNAFSSGGGSNQGAVHSAAEKKALKATRLRPNDPSAWSQLVLARYNAAGQGGNFNVTTGQFTKAGRREVNGALSAWQRYLQLTGGKDPSGIAVLAARAYAKLGNYAGAADAWEVQTAANPQAVGGYECLAATAYAAKQTRKGDLALNKTLSLVPKAQRAVLKTQIQAAKTQPSLVQQQCG
jgi:tetratricopeptide (TPR) repeat protein